LAVFCTWIYILHNVILKFVSHVIFLGNWCVLKNSRRPSLLLSLFWPLMMLLIYDGILKFAQTEFTIIFVLAVDDVVDVWFKKHNLAFSIRIVQPFHIILWNLLRILTYKSLIQPNCLFFFNNVTVTWIYVLSLVVFLSIVNVTLLWICVLILLFLLLYW